MKRQISATATAVLFLLMLPIGAQAARFLVPGGQVIGLQLQNGTVTVAAFDDILGSSARRSGLKIGDEILSVNGCPVSSAEDIRSALGSNSSVRLAVLRSGRTKQVEAAVQQTEDGPRLGIHLKQGITGIGTVTWYDPGTGAFGALGHGVSGSDGMLLNMTRGYAYRAEVVSAKQGRAGDPGLLKGNADPLGICGTLLKNTPQGVFGVTKQGWQGTSIPTADFDRIQTGPASIRSTITGSTVQEYSVEILKIYPMDRPDGRNFLIRVTDPALLDATGGIVQGMGVSYNRDNTGTLKACKG